MEIIPYSYIHSVIMTTTPNPERAGFALLEKNRFWCVLH